MPCALRRQSPSRPSPCIHSAAKQQARTRAAGASSWHVAAGGMSLCSPPLCGCRTGPPCGRTSAGRPGRSRASLQAWRGKQRRACTRAYGGCRNTLADKAALPSPGTGWFVCTTRVPPALPAPPPLRSSPPPAAAAHAPVKLNMGRGTGMGMLTPTCEGKRGVKSIRFDSSVRPACAAGTMAWAGVAAGRLISEAHSHRQTQQGREAEATTPISCWHLRAAAPPAASTGHTRQAGTGRWAAGRRTMPTSISFWYLRAAAPLAVKMAVPLPCSLELTRAMASSRDAAWQAATKGRRMHGRCLNLRTTVPCAMPLGVAVVAATCRHRSTSTCCRCCLTSMHTSTGPKISVW